MLMQSLMQTAAAVAFEVAFVLLCVSMHIDFATAEGTGILR